MAVVESDDAEMNAREPGTLAEWFAVLEGPLLRYAQRLVQSADTAQDLVQEAFMKLHVQFDTVRAPKAWLFRTTHNLALNHLRAGSKVVPVDFGPEGGEGMAAASSFTSTDPLPDEYLQRMEAIGQTRLCLKTLDERSRELLRLKFEENLSYREMSERTGLGVGNVGYILSMTLKQLGADLQKAGVGVRRNDQ